MQFYSAAHGGSGARARFTTLLAEVTDRVLDAAENLKHGARHERGLPRLRLPDDLHQRALSSRSVVGA